jgi:DNA repair protein RadA/Sms
MKQRTQFFCQHCGHMSSKWIGRCPTCEEWNSFVEESVSASSAQVRLVPETMPVRFDSIEGSEVPRTPTGVPEFDRVLGGGLVPGALILLGGDPGVGKSTLMLDVAAQLSTRYPILYASGEESSLQIKLRGDRTGIAGGDLLIYAEMNVERILSKAEEVGAAAVVVDSIQTTFSEKLDMAPGSIGQIREVASQFLVWTKQRQVPAFLIGHITKDGALAGPKALEHIVDTVLYFEGPRQHPHRIVRTIKNRFGAANELGIFEMTARGLAAVESPGGLFLSHRDTPEAGSVVVCSVEGSRPLLVELQALVSRTHLGTPRRFTTGVDPQRLALICAVIEKRLGVHLWDQDIYLNVVGGLEITEPAADLGIAAAILSSFLNRPMPQATLVFGEVGLGGEVRTCLHPGMRLKEAANLGFRRAILPAQTISETPSDFESVSVVNLNEAIDVLFGPLANGSSG